MRLKKSIDFNWSFIFSMFSNRKLCLYRYTIDNNSSNVIEPKNYFSQKENVPVLVNVNKLFWKIAV